jgi:magnesium-transporting ATPase (P-type)
LLFNHKRIKSCIIIYYYYYLVCISFFFLWSKKQAYQEWTTSLDVYYLCNIERAHPNSSFRLFSWLSLIIFFSSAVSILCFYSRYDPRLDAKTWCIHKQFLWHNLRDIVFGYHLLTKYCLLPCLWCCYYVLSYFGASGLIFWALNMHRL